MTLTKHLELVLREAGLLPTSQSLDALRDMVRGALKTTACSCDPTAKDCACAAGVQTCRCNDVYVWLRDLFADKVVYEQDGKLYQRGYKVKKGGVTFDAPIAVEIAYKPLGESARTSLRESVQMTTSEAAYDKTTKTLTMTILRPGVSKNKKLYPAAVIKRDHKMFEGAKMFINHATDAEMRTRPEGDLNAWAAQIKETFIDPTDGRMRGRAVVVDPIFEKKCENLAEAGLLPELGVSIRAIGEASPAEADGQAVDLVERFVKVRSVDFVTFAGAGGQVEALESATNDEDDVELLTEATLRERRPDLVELIESSAQEAMSNMKTTEVQLTEAQELAKTEKARADKAEAELREAQATQAKATATVELTKLLTEAKLPEKAADRIRKQFAEATKVDGMKEAIEAEREYIKSLGLTSTSTTKVRNMGPEHVETREAEAGEPETEEQKTARTKRLVEAYRATGMPLKEAEIAAGL